jgi:transglutaminase-like putative cysteine protease
MRFALRYHAEYRYDGTVYDQHNVLRVKPAATPAQRVRNFRLAVEPTARTRTYVDYFGTEATEFNVPGEHERLAITAEVEVTTQAPPEPSSAGSWDAARGRAYTDTGGEFLLHTDDEPGNGALDELRAAVRSDSPDATVRQVCQVIPDRFEYRPGATFVGSTVDDLLEGGAGVCQDFVHLALILLRDQGIAARYVSGYLFAAPEDGGQDSVEVDTHAWVEALLPGQDGGEAGWVGADPTNRKLAGEEHVKIGHGRFYGDVAPIRGVYKGSVGSAHHEVSVQMKRLG